MSETSNPEGPASRYTDRGYDRLLNFSDAVVAIAISLLILPLVDIVSNDTVGLRDLIDDHWGQLFAFALSFVVIAQYWVVHHQLFEAVSGYTNRIVWANMLWLASIVFLPLPTEMLGNASTQSRAVHGLYIGSVLVSNLTLLLVRHLVVRTREVQRTAMDPADVTTSALMALALVIAVAVPRIGMWSMALVLLSGPLNKRRPGARLRERS